MKIKLLKQIAVDTIVDSNLNINISDYITANVIELLNDNLIFKILNVSGKYVIINNNMNVSTSMEVLTSKNRIVDISVTYNNTTKEITFDGVLLFQDETYTLDIVILDYTLRHNTKKIVFSNYYETYNIIICPNDIKPLVDITLYPNPDNNTNYVYNSIIGKTVYNYLAISNRENDYILQFTDQQECFLNGGTYVFKLDSYSYNAIGHSEDTNKNGSVVIYETYPKIHIDYDNTRTAIMNQDVIGKHLDILINIDFDKCKKLSNDTVLFKDIILTTNVKTNDNNKIYTHHLVRNIFNESISIEHIYDRPISNIRDVVVTSTISIPGSIMNCNNSTEVDTYMPVTEYEINHTVYDPYTSVTANTVPTFDFKIPYPPIITKNYTSNILTRDSIYFDITATCDLYTDEEISTSYAIAGKDSITTYNLIETSKKFISEATIDVIIESHISIEYINGKLVIKSNRYDELVAGDITGNGDIDIDPTTMTNIALSDGVYEVNINIIKDDIYYSPIFRYIVVINTNNIAKHNDYLAKIINNLLIDNVSNYDIAVYDILNRQLEMYLTKLFNDSKPALNNYYVRLLENDSELDYNVIESINKLINYINKY